MSETRNGMDRRGFLRVAGGAAIAAAGAPLAALAGAEAKAEGKKAHWDLDPAPSYAPFRMAIQTYSLRKMQFDEAIETAFFDLRVSLVDLWPDHFPQGLTEAEFRRRLKTMRQNMVRRIAYGVVPLGKDAEADDKAFAHAKKLGVQALTADPLPEGIADVEKLAEKHGLLVAIHNHGVEDKRWGTPDLIEKGLKATKGDRVGLCVDTGHFLLAGVKPIDVVKRFKGRIHAVHLKDIKTEGGKGKECILGQGDLDLLGFFRALKEVGFNGSLGLEYESEPEAPVASMKKCLEAVKEAVKKL